MKSGDNPDDIIVHQLKFRKYPRRPFALGYLNMEN